MGAERMAAGRTWEQKGWQQAAMQNRSKDAVSQTYIYKAARLVAGRPVKRQ